MELVTCPSHCSTPSGRGAAFVPGKPGDCPLAKCSSLQERPVLWRRLDSPCRRPRWARPGPAAAFRGVFCTYAQRLGGSLHLSRIECHSWWEETVLRAGCDKEQLPVTGCRGCGERGRSAIAPLSPAAVGWVRGGLCPQSRPSHPQSAEAAASRPHLLWPRLRVGSSRHGGVLSRLPYPATG